MNSAAKKRLILMGLIIVVAALVLFAVLGSSSVATSLNVAQAASGDYEGKKVQVSGKVAEGVSTVDGRTYFTITDDEAQNELKVNFGGAMPSTFGSGITAICTGKMENSVLVCSELLTKCPSKYESAEGALTVKQLLKNADIYNATKVKVAGYVVKDTLKDGTADIRFVLESQDAIVDVAFSGGLPDTIQEGSAVILTGKLNSEQNRFEAEDVALDADVAARA
ncbi:MAG: cytochrome c maturation protein CcmE [Coriobacteriales bacterium]|nr:cytochrome c maturation protein CcmE [Coriobacteriales bacterium]